MHDQDHRSNLWRPRSTGRAAPAKRWGVNRRHDVVPAGRVLSNGLLPGQVACAKLGLDEVMLRIRDLARFLHFWRSSPIMLVRGGRKSRSSNPAIHATRRSIRPSAYPDFRDTARSALEENNPKLIIEAAPRRGG
jgi:hypothetical protein